MLEGSRVLITGGTGSFGNAVVGRLLKMDVKELRIFSRDEKKQEDMRVSLANDRLNFFVGDVRDLSSAMEAMAGIDYVFHAAALKQVPSCEFHPMEAIRTNILGTENVLSAAISRGVQKVVVLSTDKAVYPINAMGMSKALAEKLVVAKARIRPDAPTICCATRYGNVMASRGSVIPLFLDQIRSGGELTVTDPNMTRFLMSLEDSVDLVLHAWEEGTPGDLFVQKSPASTIGDLAQAMMEMFDYDRPLRVIGTRHGEKLHETLVSREERSRAIEDPRFFRVCPDVRDMNYKKYFVEGEDEISSSEDYTSENTQRLSVPEVKELLMTLDLIRDALDA